MIETQISLGSKKESILSSSRKFRDRTVLVILCVCVCVRVRARLCVVFSFEVESHPPTLFFLFFLGGVVVLR